MLFTSQKTKLLSKDIRKGVKADTHTEWTSLDLSFEDNGIVMTITFTPQRIYDKAEAGKDYIIKFYANPQGKLQINDIELVK